MTKREIAQLACKVIALWLIAKAAFEFASDGLMLIGDVLSVIGSSFSYEYNYWLHKLIPLTFPLSYVIVGAILWWKSDRIASGMVSQDSKAVTTGSPDYKAWLSLAISVIGIYFTSIIIIHTGENLVFYVRDHSSLSETSKKKDWPGIFFAEAVKLIIALWMVFGSRGIAAIVYRFRMMGVAKPPANGG